VRYLISRVPLFSTGNADPARGLSPETSCMRTRIHSLASFWSTRVRQASTAARRARRSALPGFDPRHEAVVEGGPPLPNTQSVGHVRVVRYGSRDVVLEIDTSGPALLATSGAYYPGWRAQIDGRDQSLYFTNVAFRDFLCPPAIIF